MCRWLIKKNFVFKSLYLSSVMLFWLWPSMSLGAISFLRASGYSQISTSAAATVIYGGFANNGAACTQDGVNTCDTCLGTIGTDNLLPCNQTSAYKNLELVTYFKTTTTDITTGQIRMFAGDTEISLSSSQKSTTLVPSIELMAKSTWSSICSAFNSGDDDCETAIASKVLKVGIDKDNDGDLDEYVSLTIVTRDVATGVTYRTYTDCDVTAPTTGGHFCYFTLAAGDEKVYVESLKYGPDEMASEVTGADYSELVFFYEKVLEGEAETTTLGRIKNNSPILSLKVSKGSSPPLEEFYLKGLSNNSKYCFVMANKDLTGNISYFTNSSVFPTKYSTMCATPEQVYGALTGKSCFIATAAYGGPLEQEVETFRQFRDRFLLKTKWGVGFVRTYYQWSPPVADMISRHVVLKAGAQVFLFPLLIVAKAALGWSLGKTFLLFVVGFLFVFRRSIFLFIKERL